MAVIVVKDTVIRISFQGSIIRLYGTGTVECSASFVLRYKAGMRPKCCDFIYHLCGAYFICLANAYALFILSLMKLLGIRCSFYE